MSYVVFDQNKFYLTNTCNKPRIAVNCGSQTSYIPMKTTTSKITTLINFSNTFQVKSNVRFDQTSTEYVTHSTEYTGTSFSFSGYSSCGVTSNAMPYYTDVISYDTKEDSNYYSGECSSSYWITYSSYNTQSIRSYYYISNSGTSATLRYFTEYKMPFSISFSDISYNLNQRKTDPFKSTLEICNSMESLKFYPKQYSTVYRGEQKSRISGNQNGTYVAGYYWEYPMQGTMTQKYYFNRPIRIRFSYTEIVRKYSSVLLSEELLTNQNNYSGVVIETTITTLE